MDWSDVAVAVTSGAVSGGVIGGGVSLLIAKMESKDRRANHDLEREKWEHERTKELRAQNRQTCQEALDTLHAMFGAIREAVRADQRFWNVVLDGSVDDKTAVVDETMDFKERARQILDGHLRLMGQLIGDQFSPFKYEYVQTVRAFRDVYKGVGVSKDLQEQINAFVSAFAEANHSLSKTMAEIT